MKKLLVGLICLHFFVLHGDYLIYVKQDDQILPIDEAQFQKIYPLLARYTWPMNISHADKVTSAMREKIHPVNEESFLREQLAHIDPHLDIAFIPSILFELFCISRIDTMAILMAKQRIKEIFKNFDSKLIASVENRSNTIKNVLSLYNEINMDPKIQKAYLTINNEYIEFIQTLLKNSNLANLKATSLSGIIKELCFVIKEELFKKLSSTPFYKNNPWLFPLNVTYENNTDALNPKKDFFARIINLEYDAYEQFAGILYRGIKAVESYNPKERKTVPIIDNMLDQNYSNNHYEKLLKAYMDPRLRSGGIVSFIDLGKFRSISYGNTLFSGFFLDQDACVLFYLYNPKTLGYALFIDKRSYLKEIAAQMNKKSSGGLEGNLFRISPLNTLVSLFARGEYFHSRSIIHISKKYPDPLIAGITEYTTNDTIGYIMKHNNILSYAAYYSSLLANPQFCHIIKLYTPMIAFENEMLQQYDLSTESQKNFIKQLFFQQKENALVLRSLVTFEKFFRKLIEKHPEIEPTAWEPTVEERIQLKEAMKNLIKQLKISK